MKKPMSQETFIERCKKVHEGKKYDYSETQFNTVNDFITIYCHEKDKDGNEHGYFTLRGYGHLYSGYGCKKCQYRKLSEERKKPFVDFLHEARKVHGDKYVYDESTYEGTHSKLSIVCPLHGEFHQEARMHLLGQGCPHCNASKLEKRINDLLSKESIEFESQKRFEWLGKQSLDFYLPNLNMAIECQGEQHYKPVDFNGKGTESAIVQFKRTTELDRKKKELLEEHNIRLIYFSNEKYDSDVITKEEELISIIKGEML
jgi:very-short-patch-repair endonuclease